MTVGFRGPAAPWLGGASASKLPALVGFRGLMAPWLGGSSATGAAETPTPQSGGGAFGFRRHRHEKAPGEVQQSTIEALRKARHQPNETRPAETRNTPTARSGEPQTAIQSRGAAEIAARTAEVQFNAANIASLVAQFHAARSTSTESRQAAMPASVVLPSGRALETATATDDDMALLMFALYLAMDD